MNEEALHLKLKLLQWRKNISYDGYAALFLPTLALGALCALSFLLYWAITATSVTLAQPAIEYTALILFFWGYGVGLRRINTIKPSLLQIFWRGASSVEMSHLVVWPFVVGVVVFTPLLTALGPSGFFASFMTSVTALLLTAASITLGLTLAAIGLFTTKRSSGRLIYSAVVLTLVILLAPFMATSLALILSALIATDISQTLLAVLFLVGLSASCLSLYVGALRQINTRVMRHQPIGSWLIGSRTLKETFSYSHTVFLTTLLRVGRVTTTQLPILLMAMLYLLLILRFELSIASRFLLLALVASLVSQLVSFEGSNQARQSAEHNRHLPFSIPAWGAGSFWATLLVNLAINGTLGFMALASTQYFHWSQFFIWLVGLGLIHANAFQNGWESKNRQSARFVSLLGSLFLALISLILAWYV